MHKSLNLSRFVKLTLLLLLFVFCEYQADAETATSKTIENDHTRLRLLSNSVGVGDKEILTLGLHFTMKPGWKVYWRSPGDAGYPPSIEWEGSENLDQAEMLWPVPLRFSILGIETLGYKDEVLFPIAVKLKRPGNALYAIANVDYLTCSDICVPYSTKLILNLKAGPASPSSFAHLINRFSARVPRNSPAHGISIKSLEVLGQGKQAQLRLTATSKTPFVKPDAFFEGPDILAFDKPKIDLQEGGLKATLISKTHGTENLKSPNGLESLNFEVTLRDGERSAIATLVATKGDDDLSNLSFAMILAIAVLGGLILNLMPCVLPVLSIKLLSIVGHGGGKKRQVQASFIASAVGVIFTFILLAASLIILKNAGMTIGWGIHFQQPWFLIAMTLIITLFACNLWGLFEFRLPNWINGLGENMTHVKGLTSHFLTGCFATLLATPCSAPFLGTAIGFALARGAVDIFAVFTALGVGLALPYIIVALLPSLATRLPKPGKWMITLRKIMGFALAGTGIWLLSVISGALGQNIGLAIGSLMLGMVSVLYLAHRLEKLWQIGGCGVAVLGLLAFSIPTLMSNQGPDNRILDQDPRFKNLWQPFDATIIPRLVGSGKIVFVDITADWCLTCQINKKFVIAQVDILNRLRSENVVAMQADWTLPDDAIAAYLAKFERYGIPFNAVYGIGAPGGLILPELLSHDIIVRALNQAR
jgi:suppressor for copper-sensitivity B